MKTQEKKIIRTVLGDISSEDLGFTLPHEHLLLDFSFMFKPSQDKEESNKSYVEVSEDMQLLAWIMYDPFRNRDNLITIDEDIAISELNLYKRVGGISLVDTTSIGLGRDPLALARISRATGINVIMGSGYYVDVLHPSGMNSMTEDQITDEIIADIEVGVKDTGVRSGVIGEIGCSWPLTVNEFRQACLYLFIQVVINQHQWKFLILFKNTVGIWNGWLYVTWIEQLAILKFY